MSAERIKSQVAHILQVPDRARLHPCGQWPDCPTVNDSFYIKRSYIFRCVTYTNLYIMRDDGNSAK